MFTGDRVMNNTDGSKQTPRDLDLEVFYQDLEDLIGSRRAFQAHGAKPVPVRVDSDGIDPEAAERLTTKRTRLLYLIQRHQFSGRPPALVFTGGGDGGDKQNLAPGAAVRRDRAQAAGAASSWRRTVPVIAAVHPRHDLSRSVRPIANGYHPHRRSV